MGGTEFRIIGSAQNHFPARSCSNTGFYFASLLPHQTFTLIEESALPVLPPRSYQIEARFAANALFRSPHKPRAEMSPRRWDICTAPQTAPHNGPMDRAVASRPVSKQLGGCAGNRS